MHKAVIITTASDVYKNDDYHIPSIKCDLNSIGFEVALLDIEFGNAEDMKNYDLIYLLGGNPFYLLYHLRKTNSKEIFENHINDNKILVGASAGSIVLTNSIGVVNEFDSEMNREVQLQNLDGLSLVNLEICPHAKRFEGKYKNFLIKIRDYEQRKNVNLSKLNDGEAIAIEGNTFESILL
jgi:dipeptidase E